MTRVPFSRLIPLFLVAVAAVAYETALARFFAVAKWSEYAYWIISITMVGFAMSGVVMALARDFFARRVAWLMPALPVALIATGALGYFATTLNPFNPLALQNAATFADQLWLILAYYAVLFPFFFLVGIYIALNFITHENDVGRVYGMDLAGAGLGAAGVLGLMWVLHPFDLVPALLPLLALAAVLAADRARAAWGIAAGTVLAASLALLLLGPRPAFNEFKAIYAPLNVPDSRTLLELRTPQGLYQLLENFTERVDTDLSNNAGAGGITGTPAALGLYRDGNRIAGLPRTGEEDTGYAAWTLDAAPYALLAGPRVLLAGASGGFRIDAVRRLGAAAMVVAETDDVVRAALFQGMGPSPPPVATHDWVLTGSGPAAIAAASPGMFDLIDLSADFLDSAEANRFAFTAEAVAAYLRALRPGGIVSMPASIRELPVYAARMISTARAGLLRFGAAEPAAHVVIVRSAWNVRLLLSPTPWVRARVAALREWANARSFDLSWYPGMDPDAPDRFIFNDLPPVSFDEGVSGGGGPQDAVTLDAAAILGGRPLADPTFDASAITDDRPFYYAALNLTALPRIADRLDILPQPEIGALVNLAVLAQALLIAAIVLAVPLVARGKVRPDRAGMLRAILYFSCLGLGFLFIEIWLIEKASVWLNDRTSAFALVLTGMLIFSGLGAMQAHRFRLSPRRGLLIAVGVILAWCAVAWLFLLPLIVATQDWPGVLRALLLLAVTAPVSVALGLPFPLGLDRYRGPAGGAFLPWAWGLNGAMSVIATPLANLTALNLGLTVLLAAGAGLYLLTPLGFPTARGAR